MTLHRAASHTFNWRIELPVLSGRIVTLREPVADDCEALVALLSIPDASRFTSHDAPGPIEVQQLIARAISERAAGTAFTYAIAFAATGHIIGLLQVRQLDPLFEAAFWDCTLATEARGTARSGKPRIWSRRSRFSPRARAVSRLASISATSAQKRRSGRSARCRKASCAGRAAADTNTSIRHSGPC
jgi:hypothetical protein